MDRWAMWSGSKVILGDLSSPSSGLEKGLSAYGRTFRVELWLGRLLETAGDTDPLA